MNPYKLYSVCYESVRKGSWGYTFNLQVMAKSEDDAIAQVKQRAPDAIIWSVCVIEDY